MKKRKEVKEVKGIICPECKQFIWSSHRHDFVICNCGKCSIDGGQVDYICINFDQDMKPPKIISKRITLK